MIKIPVATIAALALFCMAGRTPAQEPEAKPEKPAEKPAEKPKPAPKPPVYDEKADAEADVAKATARAGADNKRVLIVYGANWCGWCHLLSDLFKEDKGIAKTLLYEYEVVKVDVGKFDKAKDLIARLGATVKSIPYLTVLDGKGQVLTHQDTDSLEDGKKHDPAKVKGFLAKWKAAPLDAEEVLKAGLEKAKAEGRLALVHFGAPWCGSCRHYEGFFGRPEIAELLAADYVSIKIDEDRMTKGMDLEGRLRTAKQGNIPWTCVLDAEGKVLAVSEDARGNVAHPMEPEEVACFMGMLKKTAKKMTPEQASKLEEALLNQRSRRPGD